MTTTQEIRTPMRPGLNLGAALHPGWRQAGWDWQPKLNEERGWVFARRLFNRHAQPFDPYKAQHFEQAMESLCEVLGGFDEIDLGLVGLRDRSAFGYARGSVIVYDLPSNLPWEERRRVVASKVPEIDLLAGEKMQPGLIYCLPVTEAAGDLFHQVRGVPGLEGIVGRNKSAPYAYAEYRTMAKAKW